VIQPLKIVENQVAHHLSHRTSPKQNGHIPLHKADQFSMLEALTGIDQHQRIPPSPISCLAEKRWISPYPFDKLVPPEKTSRIVECLTSEIAAIIRMAYQSFSTRDASTASSAAIASINSVSILLMDKLKSYILPIVSNFTCNGLFDSNNSTCRHLGRLLPVIALVIARRKSWYIIQTFQCFGRKDTNTYTRNRTL
jgi:hypothetical protein